MVTRILGPLAWILAVMAAAHALTAASLHVDVVAVLVRVVDGDTIRVKVVASCNPRYSSLVGFYGRVRLADINAPELSTPEGLEAMKALESLLAGHRLVYIDVDDVKVFDRYGRIVGVVLIDYNETTLLNVNEWLLLHGYAEPRDYPNEFHPVWPLYTPKTVALAGCAPQATAATRTVTVTVTRVETRSFTETVTIEETRTTTVALTMLPESTRQPRTTTTTATITTTTTRVEGCRDTIDRAATIWILLALLAAAAGYTLYGIRGR